jgi:hypothetical protein
MGIGISPAKTPRRKGSEEGWRRPATISIVAASPAAIAELNPPYEILSYEEKK